MTDKGLVFISIDDILKDAIEEAGADGLTEGPLYAMVCGLIGLETFQAIIGALEDSGKIKRSGFMLKSCKS